MVETRRKTKQKDDDDSADSPSLNVPVPEDLDFETLSSLVPEGFDIHSPSAEDIVALYRLITTQSSELETNARELDEARAEVEKKEVELDQALQDREGLSKDMEGQLERVQEELKQVRQERDQLVSVKNDLQTQVATLSNSQTSSSFEVKELKNRLDDAEREKRDLLAIISRLKQEETQRDDEIQTLRTNLKDARQEHQVLEGQVRDIRSNETATKFKLETLSQQLELTKSESERLNGELATKSEEFAQYRRTKQAELVTLQANFDALTQTHNSAQATLKALQAAHTKQTHELTQSHAKVEDLKGQLAEQEATYSSEANSLRRLVTMLEEREKQAREIVERIEEEWAGLGEKADSREGELRAEIDRERKAREVAEDKVEKLERVLEKMGRGELPLPGRPETPTRTPDRSDETSVMMGLSPTIAMASRAQKSGKGFTEVYAEYVRLQDEYAKKCTEYDNMDRTLTAVLAQIEERVPILSQQRTEYERLQSEAAQLASQLSQALSDRDASAKLAEDNASRLTKSARENELLQQQLEDLGRQVRVLLKEIARRDDPNLPSDEELESLPPAENVEAVITNHLVLFRSIDGLQDQNQKLLKIVRELGQKMENEERDYREAMEKEQGEAVREAHEAMQDLAAQLERQKKSSESIIQAYVKERDALKAMLARTEKGVVNGSVTSDAATPGSSELAQELAEIQRQFDAYRTEMGIDVVKLREELLVSQRETSQLQAALAKANAKIEYLSDRNRINQEQFALHRQELDDMNRRNSQLFDQWTRADIECGRVTEDLRTAASRVEQLRNECANLRAEKKIWEGVQSRLVEENRTLAMERSHLSDLMSNVQKMHSDLERSGENDRRRLESQLQLLEGQTQDLRTQLMQEREAVRQVTLQKDIELKELQNRLDKSTLDLSSTRESLVIAETTKTHQGEKIRDLTKQLHGNEEKLAVYERRSGAPISATTTSSQDLTKEQQLEAEVADLRSKIKVAEIDLATAKGHVQQFQEISQANETALESLNATHDEFKASTEAQIAKYESEKKALEQRLQEAQQELQQLTSKHNDLQKQFETERTAWVNDKKTLEDTIVDLSTSERMTENDRVARENEVKVQEERAKAAEEKYSNEIVAHAESIKAIESLKKQLSVVQVTVREHQTAAETADAKLIASEGSWGSQKAVLEEEITNLKARYQEVTEQNNLLHQHLEAVSSQAARIRQAADTTVAADGEAQGGDNDAKLSELRSVVAYLRKQKEIVDLQLELSKQENVRLKAQVDHLQQTLNETRQTLSEERERAVEAAASAVQHNELVERINQLNILRESNATLRSDCEAQTKRAQALEAKLAALSRKLEPAEEAARIAKAELEARDAHVKRLEEENRKWQERNQQLLSKYDRTDPAELQALKNEIEQARAQKAELEAILKEREEAAESQKQKLEAVEKNLATFKELYSKNMNGARNRIGELNTQKTQMQNQVKELEAKVATLQLEIETLRSVNEGAPASSQPNEGDRAIINALREERDRLLAEKESSKNAAASGAASLPAGNSTSEEVQRAWETEKAELIKSRDEALVAAKTASESAEKSSNAAKANKAAFERLQQRVASDAKKAEATHAEAINAAVEKAKAELQSQPPSPGSEELLKKHQAELQALENRLATKFKTDLEAAVEAAKKEATASSESVPDVQAAIAAAIAKHSEESETKLQQEIEAAVERGRLEMTSKLRVKESQLVRYQAHLKAYEAKLEEWKKAGTIPVDTKVVPPTNVKPTAGGAAAAGGPAAAGATPAKAAIAAAANQGSAQSTPTKPAAPLPRKPPVGGPPNTTPATPAGEASSSALAPARVPPVGAAAGRGRGGAPVRQLASRGGAPGAPRPAGQPLSGGVAIMGAAKRPASEAPAGSEESLAKRLKPAGQAGSSGPVTLKRPPPSGQAPPS
ncbi:filament-forming protein [Moniliophthora roreri MCA 2997]|uniref:Filament-forming protein n=2 Tax=Moniliophthora roreri TaxID=221103 RepID=V2YUB0_MONRO|nr:filament-forming protein [Moniliophthora roreri MCA 2997]